MAQDKSCDAYTDGMAQRFSGALQHEAKYVCIISLFQIIAKETALLIVLFYGTALAQDDVALANDYVDNVLDMMRNDRDLLAAIDPLQVPDFGENSFQITGGQVLGLSAFYRSGNSTVQMSNDMAIVTTPAAVNDVFFTGRHRASRFGLTISGDIEASVNRVNTLIVYRAPIKGGEARLEYFQLARSERFRPQVDRMDGLKVTRITGVSSAFNWLLKIVANRVARHFQGRIEAALQDEVSKFISTQVDRSRFPALSGNGSRISGESFAYPSAPF
ncbi:uncharacterized protein LOC119376165 [Rhipicephalus sanguineus]|uniref:uncharacterized protein LOC119376165 n=1 Tax=Rhipicephalus sanguineus TaxID=34632 RepID=UPI0020C51A52|nr:uncharacterized protein LOC119376165 [Rhipicephalus sanguineus]